MLAAFRLQRWTSQLSAYQYDIEYRASQSHNNADALSRLPRKSVEETQDWTHESDQVNRVQIARIPITASEILEATKGDPVFSRVIHCVLRGWPVAMPEELKIYYSKRDEFTVEDGCLLHGTRVIIPAKYQAAVLSELHLNHPGMVRRKFLCTNIPQEEGINIKNEPPIPTRLLQRALKLILAENSFQFNGKNYVQIHGTAMDTKMAVAFANIFIAKVTREEIT